MLNKAWFSLSSNMSVHLKNNVPSFRWVWLMSQRFSSSNCLPTKEVEESNKVHVDGVDINYVRVGTGEHPVLLLPGAIGSIWTDFKPQIENFNREKFTVIAWDPPGYGRSRPPNRTFPNDFYHRDAIWARSLMKTLGYDKFSPIGWSDGGITSLILAATYPENMRRMVTVAANAYVTPEEADIYKKYRNIDSWSDKMRAPMIEVYGKDYFQKTWSDWVDALLRISKEQNGNLCKELLAKIKCPTLIVQGSKDPMVSSEHPIYLQKHIAYSKMHIFDGGAHNLHLRYAAQFTTLVTKFLTGSESGSEVIG